MVFVLSWPLNSRNLEEVILENGFIIEYLLELLIVNVMRNVNI